MTYRCRFISQAHAAELVNLYHLARTALAGQRDKDKPYDRKVWASAEYAKRYRLASPNGAYKDLCGLLEWI